MAIEEQATAILEADIVVHWSEIDGFGYAEVVAMCRYANGHVGHRRVVVKGIGRAPDAADIFERAKTELGL